MNKIILIILFIFSGLSNLFAQHCEFDGTYLIVVHLGKSLPKGASVWLEENKSSKDSKCTDKYSKLKLKFDSELYFWMKKEMADQWKNGSKIDTINYVLTAGYTDLECSTNNQGSGNPDTKFKNFSIVIRIKNKVLEKVSLDPSLVYHLCSDAGSFDRIRAVNMYSEIE